MPSPFPSVPYPDTDAADEKPKQLNNNALTANEKSLERMVNFFYEVGLTRNKDRTWDSLIGTDMANVAEHIYRVIWITAYLISMEGGSEEEILLGMAIAAVHDKGELRTGDQNPFQKAYVTVNEALAVEHILAGTPFGPLMQRLYTSYKTRDTLAAKCVKDADILDTAFELHELASTGHMYPQASSYQMDIKRKAYFTESARNLHDLLVKLGPAARWNFRNDIESTFKQGTYGK